MADSNGGRSAVYRLFDANGCLLYVGVTDTVTPRLYGHGRTQPWWSEVDVTRTSISWFGTRDEAEQAEVTAISSEAPKHNVVVVPAGRRSWGGRPWTPTTDEHRAALAALETAARNAEQAERQVWTAVDAARDVGVPMSHAAKTIGRGRTTAYRRRNRQP